MWRVLVVSLCLVHLAPAIVSAGEDEERVVEGIISGLLGQPQSQEAAYTAKERDRLVSLLQSGEYVTSRQGEPVDLMVYGIPLTHKDHVYSAKPIPPSQTSYQPGQQR